MAERESYLVELVEIAKDDRIIRDLREQLCAHLPSPLLLFVPGDTLLLCIRRTLPVVTAEEGVPAVDDILAIHPFDVVTATVLISQLILHVDVSSPGPKR